MSASSPRPPSVSWKDTWLWETLLERKNSGIHSSSFLRTLEEWMVKLDTVLRSGGTSPQDFTLHDERHSLRVADRMAQLLTDEVREKLSDHEIALLLLAAYGHDVGMTPARNKVQAHHRHLFHPQHSALTESEIQQFQKFLDEWQDQPVLPPISNTPAGHDLADELTAFYVRDRHNEWSAEWLRENLNCDSFGNLQSPVEILIRLCSSHHWSFERLRSDDFDPILTNGPQPQLVHLRYLACILRLADILENDPERTPKVLYEHRNIEDRKKSLIHWRKDHAFTVDIRENQLHFHARPPDAHVHKALEELADWIDHELNGIASLGDRLPVHNTVGSETISRKWHLAPALTRDIKPFDSSYEYIEGAFRPDTARLLQLLSNEQLYGNPLVAVRALLQNAFDAVREKIARKRLEPQIENPADRIWEERLGNQEQVTLTLKPGADGGWLLICEDTGVGLTKALITGHLLVSGHTRRHAILDLERRCQEKGFRLGRTGQCGIGVLSYFMLADEVEIQTTRDKACSDDDGPGWSFTTRGVGSFGELRKLTNSLFSAGGTRVQWKLRPEQITNPAKLANDLLDYLKLMLCRIPCRFEFKTARIPGSQDNWNRPTGWTKSEEDWLATFKREIGERTRNRQQVAPTDSIYVSEERANQETEKDQAFERARNHALSILNCEFSEFDLPCGSGRARYILPYYDLPQGCCVTSKPADFKDDYEIGSEFNIRHRTINSWKGMLCKVNPATLLETHEFHLKVASAEVDIDSLTISSLSVNRDGVTLSSPLLDLWETHLESLAENWVDRVLEKENAYYFHEVNLSRQERPLDLIEGSGWFHWDSGSPFRPIHRPLALPTPRFGSLYKCDHGSKTCLIDCDNKPVSIIVGGGEKARIKPNCQIKFIDRPEASRQIPCLFWPANGNIDDSIIKDFPTEWHEVGIVHVPDHNSSFLSGDTTLTFLSRTHPLITLLTEEETIELAFNRRRNWVSIWEQIDKADTAALAAIALCRLVLRSISSIPDEWETYQRQRANHLLELWTLISAKSGRPLDSLRLIATNCKTDALVSPFGLTSQSVIRREPPIVPRVTDPAYLLREVTTPNSETPKP